MSLKDLAEGVRGSQGTITLSRRDVKRLQQYVDKSNASVTIDRMSNGGAIIKCQDLCNLVLGPDEPVISPKEEVDVVETQTLTPFDGDEDDEDETDTDLEGESEVAPQKKRRKKKQS